MADKITPELSRIFHMDKVTAKTKTCFHVKADQAEREALAKRFELIDLKYFEVEFTIDCGREEASYEVAGKGIADVVQTCVVTLKDVPAHLEFSIKLIVQEGEEKPIDENDLSFLEEEVDVEYYQENQIDLGEIAAQYLALALDPYPHAEGADKASIGDEKEVLNEIISPFAVLQKLKQ